MVKKQMNTMEHIQYLMYERINYPQSLQEMNVSQ